MAKMSGPEEFFEAFREKRPEQTPVRRNEDTQPKRSSLSSAARPEKTITIKVRTLTTGIASSVLLIILAYFVGASQNNATQPANGGAVQAGSRQNNYANQRQAPANTTRNGGENPIVPANNNGGDQSRSAVTQYRQEWVIKVTYYENQSEKLRSYADEFINFLRNQEAIASSGVFVFPRDEENGKGFFVCIGPFKDPADALARKVMDAVRNDIVYHGSKFKDAKFSTIKEPVQ